MHRRGYSCHLATGCQSPVLEGAARDLCDDNIAPLFSSAVGYFLLARQNEAADTCKSALIRNLREPAESD